ncbi:hypothetical protein [Marinifilum flexuosum]|nr:hypothetical protein [Marinifilum flexuosum]
MICFFNVIYSLLHLQVEFKIKRLEIEIYHKNGCQASKNGSDFEWKYAATVANTEFAGDKIVVKAFDYPGNETDKEFVLG